MLETPAAAGSAGTSFGLLNVTPLSCDCANTIPAGVSQAMSITPLESTTVEGAVPAPRLTGPEADGDVSVIVAAALTELLDTDVAVSVTVPALAGEV